MSDVLMVVTAAARELRVVPKLVAMAPTVRLGAQRGWCNAMFG